MLTTRGAIRSLRIYFVAAAVAIWSGRTPAAELRSATAQPAPASAKPAKSPPSPATAAPSSYAGFTFIEDTIGPTGSEAGANAPLPLIIGLHGLGDVPEHFIHLLRELPLRARVAAPRAPLPYGPGYAWLPPRRPHNIDERAGPVRQVAEQLAPAIAALAAAHPLCGRPIVVGFSQGAMVAYGLAVSPHPGVRAVFPISGYLPPSLIPTRAPAGAPSIVALHGTADGIVALPDDEGSIPGLTRAGYAVELRTFPGIEHTVSPQMRAELAERIRNVVRAMGCKP